MHTSQQLKEAVIKTLSYFDGLEMPLTAFEVFHYLQSNQAVSFDEVHSQLQMLAEERCIEHTGPYYVIPGRQELIDARIVRGFSSEKKFATARKVARLLRYIPYVRMVAVCNTLAFDMTRKEGDIDVFIVIQRGRLYFTRAVITALIQLIGLRRHGLSITDRICLSFFVDEEGMDVSRFSIPGGDPYLAYWTRQLIPMFSTRRTYEKFWGENKGWLEKYFFHPEPYRAVSRRLVGDTIIPKVFRTVFEVLLLPVIVPAEISSRFVQQGKMRKAHDRHIRLSDSAVVVNNHTLKFHEEDRREFYRDHMYDTARQVVNNHHA